jgi:hypothetical protein
LQMVIAIRKSYGALSVGSSSDATAKVSRLRR